MNENYDLKRFGADKIVLLGLFILSLLIAQLIVSMNSVIQFTEPIKLEHAGLSLSIPTGKGWQSSGKWQYENNAFVLSSNFMAESGVPAAVVNCRYFVTSQKDLDRLPFKQSADDSNNANVDMAKMQKGSLTIYEAHVDKPFTVFLGAAELPNNRTISIEVIQTTYEIDVAEKVFKNIIESLGYSEDNPVKTGSDMVSKIQSEGLGSFLNDDNRQVCFFIQDSNNRNMGFTFDLLDSLQNGDQPAIKGASQLHLSGYNYQEQVTLFRCDNNLGGYVWETQTVRRAGRTDIKIGFDGSGTVTKQTNNSYEEIKYPSGTKIVPSIFIELLIGVVVRDKVKEAAIEMISPEGKIFPVIFSLKSADERNGIISLEFPEGRGISETFYLNEQRRIFKAAIEGSGGYYLERTGIEGIEAEFPQRADYILQRYQTLENNGL